VDALIAKGWVDKDRVASMGWSQDGYISAFYHRLKRPLQSCVRRRGNSARAKSPETKAPSPKTEDKN
jgi:hypothetical protein